MLTLNRKELSVEVRESPILSLFDPVKIFLGGEIILILARYPAGMTSHAFGRINKHPVTRHRSGLLPFTLPSSTKGKGKWRLTFTLETMLYAFLIFTITSEVIA